MKLIATAAFLALPSANAIYLACCKRENECPTDRTDVMGLGDASFKVCCYDGEKVHADEKLEDIPKCLEDIGTKGGPSIALMALPVPEGAEVQEPNGATPELANASDVATTLVATTAAEVPEETNALTESPEATDNAEGTIENAPAVAAETTSTTNVCCGALAAVQQLRTGPVRTSVCPENMFGIDGATYEDGGSSYQVCCDADDCRASEFVDSALSACEDGTTQTPLDSNDAVGLVDSAETAPAESSGDAEAQGGPDVDADESNSANAMKNAAIIGMTLVGAVLQVAL